MEVHFIVTQPFCRISKFVESESSARVCPSELVIVKCLGSRWFRHHRGFRDPASGCNECDGFKGAPQVMTYAPPGPTH